MAVCVMEIGLELSELTLRVSTPPPHPPLTLTILVICGKTALKTPNKTDPASVERKCSGFIFECKLVGRAALPLTQGFEFMGEGRLQKVYHFKINKYIKAAATRYLMKSV